MPRRRVRTICLLLSLVSLLGLLGAFWFVQPTRASSARLAQDAGAPEGQTTAVPAFSHIFVVVLENKELPEIVGNARAPYLNGLAAEYGLATQYFGVTHPSLPNYLALVAGDTLGVTSNCLGCFQSAPNLADQVEASGRTWRGYFESMPSPCFVGDGPGGLYVQKHNPFIYFDAIRSDPARCGRIVPFGRLSADLAAGDVPDLIWIGPNMRSSTHDGSIADGDRWLAAHLPEVLQSSAFLEDGLLVVTYDEGASGSACCGRRTGGGRIVTVVASPLGRRGFTSARPYDHYSLLRTIEDAWGLDRLGHATDASTSNLADFFTQPGSS